MAENAPVISEDGVLISESHRNLVAEILLRLRHLNELRVEVNKKSYPKRPPITTPLTVELGGVEMTLAHSHVEEIDKGRHMSVIGMQLIAPEWRLDFVLTPKFRVIMKLDGSLPAFERDMVFAKMFD